MHLDPILHALARIFDPLPSYNLWTTRRNELVYLPNDGQSSFPGGQRPQVNMRNAIVALGLTALLDLSIATNNYEAFASRTYFYAGGKSVSAFILNGSHREAGHYENVTQVGGSYFQVQRRTR